MKLWGRAIVFFLLSYGMLYFSYKFYIPLIGGGNDFYNYYKMYINPLDFTQTHAPFIYRQFSATITNIIYEWGIFYNTTISFTDSQISQKLFFASILSNYLALVLTALTVSKTVDLYVKNSFIYPLIGGAICFMSFGVSTYVLTGLTEGWTWFLIAIGFYSLKSNNLKLFIIISLVSIFQKEIISIILGIFSFIYFVYHFKYNESKNLHMFYIKTFLISLGSFLTYIIVRKVLMPVDGHANQLSTDAWLNSFLNTNFSEISFVIPTLLSSNLLYLLISLFLIIFYKYKQDLNQLYKADFVAILFTVAGLYFIGIITSIGTNIGRILLNLSPIISVIITYYFYIIEEKTRNKYE